MDNMRLTRRAQALLGLLYEQYEEQCRIGTPMNRAKYFGSAESIKQLLGLDWMESDVAEVCRELSDKDLLSVLYLDGTVGESCLTTEAIILMEHKFGDDAAAFLDWIGKIRAAIFG